jgi:hypothetical protein
MPDAMTIAFLFGGKTLRGLLADIRWGWSSDELDAEQRRRHEDDDHQIEMRRKLLELEREFPDGVPRVREMQVAKPHRELPSPPDLEGRTDDAQNERRGQRRP